MITFGEVSNGVFLNGWLPHPLVLSVNGINEYQMKFNIQTHDIEGKLTLVPCVVESDMAKTLYEEYRHMDFISVFGQLHHVYNPTLPRSVQTQLKVKVLGYTIVSNQNIAANTPKFSDEKQQFMDEVLRQANNIYDSNRPKPTPEEIKKWLDYWKNYRK